MKAHKSTYLYLYEEFRCNKSLVLEEKLFLSCPILLYFQDLKYRDIPLQRAPRLDAYFQEAEEVKKSNIYYSFCDVHNSMKYDTVAEFIVHQTKQFPLAADISQILGSFKSTAN